jgi:hydroxymethylpyrimidine pyrophosphatase-like HAD family hydrolase
MRISFDFDGTLVDEFGGHPSNSQKDEVQGLAKKYLSEGHEVMIITKRFGPENADKGIKNEHLEVQELAKKLGIKTIHFTNREMKFSYIINLGVDRHFENDDYEVQLINQVCKERNHICLVVPVEDAYWRDLVY